MFHLNILSQIFSYVTVSFKITWWYLWGATQMLNEVIVLLEIFYVFFPLFVRCHACYLLSSDSKNCAFNKYFIAIRRTKYSTHKGNILYEQINMCMKSVPWITSSEIYQIKYDKHDRRDWIYLIKVSQGYIQLSLCFLILYHSIKYQIKSLCE